MTNAIVDPNGRFIIMNISTHNIGLCITSIYGLNVDDPSFHIVHTRRELQCWPCLHGPNLHIKSNTFVEVLLHDHGVLVPQNLPTFENSFQS